MTAKRPNKSTKFTGSNPATRPPSLPERLAERIHHQIVHHPVTKLPSASRLARRFHVSRTTILRACELLRHRGVLDYSRGRSMRVVGEEWSVHTAPESSPRERLYRFLRDEITAGHLRIGARLPKAAYYARTYHAAERTVRSVYRRLIAEGLLHRAGRTWIVGPPAVAHPSFSMIRTPVVAVVLAHIRDWRALAFSERTRDFCAAFSNECTRHRVRLTPYPILTGGKEARLTSGHYLRIRQSIEKHGQWHIGTLVVWPRKMVPEMTPLVETLLLSGKPVVWLDHSNHPHPPDIRRPGFIRCRFSEREGLLRALATLEELGHSRIGYLGRTGYDGWEGKRYQGCVELARRRWPRMTIHRCAVRADELGIRDKPMHWPETDAQPEDWLAAPESISEKERVALDRGELTPTLISHGRQFEDLLHHHPHITAVIVSNQYRACELYSYLRWRGVSIPRDISLVTFDNYLQFQIWPLTTVDFGFGNLGYRAFQAIRGEIPVRIGTNRDMLTEALLINRGSLDAPRSHGFLHSPATPPWYPHRTSL